jgi:hypothetical protein
MSCLRSLDMFGHKVQLNVDQENKTHKTFAGACLSIIYTFIVVGLIGFCTVPGISDLHHDAHNAVPTGKRYLEQ